MLVGASMFVRALIQYRATRAAGPAKPRSVPLVALGLVVCVGVGVGALVSNVSPATVPTEAGSCWTVSDSEHIKPAPCSGAHEYKKTNVVSDSSSCTDAYVELDSGKIGCLVKD